MFTPEYINQEPMSQAVRTRVPDPEHTCNILCTQQILYFIASLIEGWLLDCILYHILLHTDLPVWIWLRENRLVEILFCPCSSQWWGSVRGLWEQEELAKIIRGAGRAQWKLIKGARRMCLNNSGSREIWTPTLTESQWYTVNCISFNSN